MNIRTEKGKVEINVSETDLLEVARKAKGQLKMDSNKQIVLYGELVGHVVDIRHLVPVNLVQGLEITITKGHSKGKRFFVLDIEEQVLESLLLLKEYLQDDDNNSLDKTPVIKDILTKVEQLERFHQ